ncbi:hypothetical protein Tco_1474652 [Tanacetum coccineum]
MNLIRSALMAKFQQSFSPIRVSPRSTITGYLHATTTTINNNYNPQPSFNQNFMQQPIPNPEEHYRYSQTAMNMALALMAKAFKLNYSTPTNNNQRISSNPRNRQIAQPGMNMGQDRQMQIVGANGGNQFRIVCCGRMLGSQMSIMSTVCLGNQVVHYEVQNQGVQENFWEEWKMFVAAWVEVMRLGNNGNQIRCYNCRGLGHLARNYTVRPRRRDAAYLQTQLLIAQKEEAGIQLQAKEFDLMAAAADLDEIEEVNANCILIANLQQASTSGTQTDNAPVYDSDGSAEINALHLSSGKQITTLNEEISDLSKQLSTEKSTVSSLLEEKKKLKSDFKIREDELLDKQIQLENKIRY